MESGGGRAFLVRCTLFRPLAPFHSAQARLRSPRGTKTRIPNEKMLQMDAVVRRGRVRPRQRHLGRLREPGLERMGRGGSHSAHRALANSTRPGRIPAEATTAGTGFVAVASRPEGGASGTRLETTRHREFRTVIDYAPPRPLRHCPPTPIATNDHQRKCQSQSSSRPALPPIAIVIDVIAD